VLWTICFWIVRSIHRIRKYMRKDTLRAWPPNILAAKIFAYTVHRPTHLTSSGPGEIQLIVKLMALLESFPMNGHVKGFCAFCNLRLVPTFDKITVRAPKS
jgi:hypothetical protein